ncbi:hypothetical protein ACFP1Z_11965 [Streptomyces gamaensis]|uniref:Uncharacterized protein n=1 Tax=Streptomyces gamaensis TaxID=1763542 RepID=A0ABW0YXG3_9ACTN
MKPVLRRLTLSATAAAVVLTCAPAVQAVAQERDSAQQRADAAMAGELCVYSRRSEPFDLDKEALDLLKSAFGVPAEVLGSGDAGKIYKWVFAQYSGNLKKAQEDFFDTAKKNFGSGSFGHTWLAYFPNDGKRYESYGTHNDRIPAFQINHGTSDNPARDHVARLCVPVDRSQEAEWKKIGEEEKEAANPYTWRDNCTEFAGRAWNRIMAAGDGKHQLGYEQQPATGGLADTIFTKLGVSGLATPGQIGHAIGVANGSPDKPVYKKAIEVVAAAPLPGSGNEYAVMTKDRVATVRFDGARDSEVGGSRPLAAFTKGAAFDSLDSIASFSGKPTKSGGNEYTYYVFSGDRYASVDARLSGTDVQVTRKGSVQKIGEVPALKGMASVDAVMNVDAETFVVFSGSTYRYITVKDGDLSAAVAGKAGTLPRGVKVDAVIPQPGSDSRWIFSGGSYRKIDRPDPALITTGGAKAVDEHTWPSLLRSGIAS